MIKLIAAREAVRVLKVKVSPTVRVYLCEERTLIVARQLNSEPLHLRRYYVFKHPHALNPLLAAVISLLAPADSVYDPCCGSGTIPIEYALASRDTEVLCSDVRMEYAKGARRNSDEAGVQVEAFTADLFHCPLVRCVELLATDPPRKLNVAAAYRYLRTVLSLASSIASKAVLVTPHRDASLLAAESWT